MKTDLPNLLTASSILLGIITALYGLFYSEIKTVLDITPKKHKIDNTQEFNKSKKIIQGKYLPLLFGSLVITIINIPELYRQLRNSYIAIKGIENASYDTLIASFIAVCFFMILFSIIIIITGFKLRKKIKELNPKK